MSRSSGPDKAVSDRKRYAAVVEKGENAWKREWSSFMSGVSLKRLRDGSSSVALKASADIERQIEPTYEGKRPTSAHTDAGAAAVNSDGIPLAASAGNAAYSYLFSSPAERRTERDARERAEKEKRQTEKRAAMAKKDPLSVMSKHQRALHEATQRGLKMEGMNRKARRDFLHLTISEAQKKAEEQSKEFRLHDLMDDKLAWYQQGPHPIDLISEKLVKRKAEKKAKQLGLRYNYLAPHASWLAKRAQRRRESLLVGLGKRFIFHDEDDQDGEAGAALTVTDPLHNRTVLLKDMGLLLAPSRSLQKSSLEADTDAAAAGGAAAEVEAREEEAEIEAAVQEEGDSAEDNEEEANHTIVDPGLGVNIKEHEEGGVEEEVKVPVKERKASTKSSTRSKSIPTTTQAKKNRETAAAPPVRLPDIGVLQDPSRIASSVVRNVVRDRATAVAIQQLNRTTTFLSSGLVKGPSLVADEDETTKTVVTRHGSGGAAPSIPPSNSYQRPSSSRSGKGGYAATAPSKPRPTRASNAPSFSPF